jgi:hypothetical protein
MVDQIWRFESTQLEIAKKEKAGERRRRMFNISVSVLLPLARLGANLTLVWALVSGVMEFFKFVLNCF